ncbi:MAG TPA: 16S rRNA (uracil(1498)-N(3))-methyltransferase [Nitrospirae bacterium]|nr:16S rRNA (uracil(1498)-N(3))-methyltransferase [Nitrospirota bacterium]
MIRIFLPPEQLTSEEISITGDQARYLFLVLRVTPGDAVIIFDGQGHKYTCKVLSSRKKETLVHLINKETYSVESPLSITLAQGIAKGDRMDFIVQKSTELGVKKIVPLVTERSEVKRTNKVDRWRKIALSASQQSGREKVPNIFEPLSLEEFLNTHGTDKGMIFSEEEKEQHFKETLNAFQGASEITLLIGPEGGFSKNEVSTAIQKGFISVSLGPRILRTETAPLTALSIVQYELGDMG